ncbi:MAG: sensor histidine kinase N-terminal domain-containing protein [Roseicyclus sp.]
MSAARVATDSIGRRLTLLLAGVAALLSVMSWAMVAGLARQAAERTQDNVLAASATIIAETLRTEQGELRLELPYAAFAMLGAISEDRVFYLVTAGAEVLTGYADLPSPADPAPGRVDFDTGGYRGEEVRMASLTRVVLTGAEPVPVTVTVAQTRSGVDAVAGDLSRLAAVLSVAFFLVAVVLSFVAARTSLAPLNEIAQAVACRGPSDLRPLCREAPAELAPLVNALNRLMERLGQSIRRSEDFIAEAAHRVRTPLATVRAQAEIALRSTPEEEARARLRQIIRAVDESSRSAGQLLDHATVAFRADDLARDRFNLAALVVQTVDAVRPTAAMKDINIRLDACPAEIEGDPILLENALHNVLDNAIKYSPEETEVTVAVGRDGQDLRVQVIDEGPGLGEDPVERLTERFQRGGNAKGVVGSGLGLTIARDVVNAHGGHLDFAPGPCGRGTCVSLILPSS